MDSECYFSIVALVQFIDELHGNAFPVRLTDLSGLSCASFCEVVQNIIHRLAGNPDQAAKWVVQFQN
jgi:hypothetical protein